MHCVQAQAVKMELLDPVQRVADDKLPNRLGILTVIIDAGTPGRLVAVSEEGGRVAGQVIPSGSEMVVDDVQKDGDAMRVGGRLTP